MSRLAGVAKPVFDFSFLTADNLILNLESISRHGKVYHNAGQVTEVCREFLMLAVPLLTPHTCLPATRQEELKDRLQAYLLNEKMGQSLSMEAQRNHILANYASHPDNIRYHSQPYQVLAWAALEYLLSPVDEISRAWYLCMHARAMAQLHPNLSTGQMERQLFTCFQHCARERNVL